MGNRWWTEKEISILKEKYPEQGPDIPELDRTRKAIYSKAKDLGLSAPSEWTKEELSILKEKYPKKGSDIPELDRTRGAIRKQAERLDLSYRWTEEEISILKEKYPKHGSDIPELNRSKTAIHSKASELGLSYDRGNHIILSNTLREYLDGLLLGDGCIVFKRGRSPYYTHVDKHRNYIVWLRKRLKTLGLPYVGSIYKREEYGTYYFCSNSAIELKDMRERWYPNGKKKIPSDLEITPIILKNWYVGDGSRIRRKSGWEVRIACFFDKEGKRRLVEQIK